MATPNHYAVPLHLLDRVRVSVDEQVEQHPAQPPYPYEARLWGGWLVPACGDAGGGGGGGGGGGDGDGGCD